VVVLDRDVSLGAEGVVAQEIKAALAGRERAPEVVGLVMGVGGRDITPEKVAELVRRLERGQAAGEPAGGSQWVEVMP
jgi:pyruvate/2-oxoacid:ferredoxin oxidoreductase alpha subunit